MLSPGYMDELRWHTMFLKKNKTKHDKNTKRKQKAMATFILSEQCIFERVKHQKLLKGK